MKFFKGLLPPLLISLSSLLFSLIILPLTSLYLFKSPRLAELGFFESWNIWDGPHYLDIATNSYVSSGEDANWIVFLPFYPMLVSSVNFLIHMGVLYAGFFVSAIASIGAAITFYKLLLFDETKKTSFLALVLLFIFPTSFFLFLPYPESVFLLLTLLTFFNLRKGNFLSASIFAMFATATKIAGLTLVPVIFVELVLHHRQFKKPAKFLHSFLILNLPILGFLFYLWINYFTFGDIFHFQKIQNYNWNTSFYPVFPGIKQAINFTSNPEFELQIYLGFAQILAFVLTLATVIYSYFKLRKSYFIFSLSFLLIYSSLSFWLSYPRYLLSLFPLFIMLGKLSAKKLFMIFWISLSLIWLFIFGTIALNHGSVL